MKGYTIILSISVALAGCAGMSQTKPTWSKPGGTIAQNDKDDRECNYDAQKVFYANIRSPIMGRYLGQQTFDACMQARGYTSR